MDQILFESAYGSLTLSRGPEERNRSLQAWNSADQYMLEKMSEDGTEEGSHLLIVNDSFGALTVPLTGKFKVYCWNDSFCAEKHIRRNLRENGIDENTVVFLSPEDHLPGSIDLVLLKNPKSLNFLEFILQRLSRQLPEGTKILAGDMARNIHRSTVSLFESFLPGAKTSLAWKKARLVEGSVSRTERETLTHTEGSPEKSPARNPDGSSAGETFPVEYKPEGLSSTLVNYPNLFAFGRLDPGSAFMIGNMPEPASVPQRIVDVACGDGVLALKAAELWPEASFLCTDESRLAVRSARESFERNDYGDRAEFMVTDGLEGVEPDQADLVLCNPPFHDNHSLSTSTALKMFSQSREVLKRGGELFVIANRHLGYEKSLGRLFSKVSVFRTNKKFAIIRAVK
ncbi:methyltransferase [Spirochaeta isovalerica]|uniref:23S rRNA (Guanine1835-N2)-methyltransferase n=1 Tax=Spirochaeta isovalerica TaxID=150 RepID=A0A841RGL4_9SPIO|nr:methyltransferase [Spirochaeta isovalerica]MBB6481658.1 23S rRNA (guanine1835-N2)-methyltransferase [Spirochaeta isovalerica]